MGREKKCNYTMQMPQELVRMADLCYMFSSDDNTEQTEHKAQWPSPSL